MPSTLKLYDSSSSNASFRARIIMYLKRIPFERIEVEVASDSKDRKLIELNNQRMVPVLTHGEFVLTQSIAIAEYLEEIHPEPRLLPLDIHSRAHVRSLALIIASDGQPVVNLRVRRYIERDLGLSRQHMISWMQYWLFNSLQEYEGAIKIRRASGPFSYGSDPTVADAFLVPQVLLSQRFGVDLSPFKEISSIHDHCMKLPAFQRAASEYVIKDAEYGV
jgi:maleylacetoacetate isomerase